MNLSPKLQQDLKDSFKSDGTEKDTEYAEIINRIRVLLKDQTKDPMVFNVIEQIFYIKAKTEFLENIPLKLDYNQIQQLSIMLELPKHVIESDIKEMNNGNHLKQRTRLLFGD